MNLRDSGVQGRAHRAEARLGHDQEGRGRGLQGHDPRPTAPSGPTSSLVLAPDELQVDIYTNDLGPNMKPGAALAFAHGLNVHFNLITPRKDIDVS